MSYLKVHNANGGTNGATVTTADTGSGDQWGGVYIGSGCSFTYDNTTTIHGNPLSYKVVPSGTTDRQAYGVDSLGSTTKLFYGRTYINLSALPTNRFALWRGYAGASLCCDLGINTGTGRLDLKDPSATITGGTGSVAVTTAAWARVNWQLDVTGATGHFNAQLFQGANLESLTQTDAVTGTSTSMGAGIDTVRMGNSANNGLVATLRMSDIVYSLDTDPTFWVTGETSGSTAPPTPSTTPTVLGYTVLNGLLVPDPYAPAVS